MGKMAVYKWTEVGDAMISCFTTGHVSNETWDAYLNDLKTKRIKRSLGLGIGTLELTSLQRKAAADAVRGRGITSAVVTDDKFVRGLVTVGGWLGADVKAFSWVELDAAVAYLKVPSHLKARVISEGMALKAECQQEDV